MQKDFMTTNVLTNITLGVDIADTCDNNEIAIKRCLQFDFTQKKRGFFGNDRLVQDV